MLIENLRINLFGVVLSELYRKCGLLPCTKSNTAAEVYETEAGTLFYGYEFNLVLKSKKNENRTYEIVLCDICFNSPTTDFVDEFAKKLERASAKSEINVIGVIAFTEELPTAVAKYACDLSVYTLTYYGNPVIDPIITVLDLLCTDYVNTDSLEGVSIRLRHEVAGFLQGFLPLQFLQAKPYFKDGFQLGFINIKSKLDDHTLSFLAKTSGGFLIHLLGKDSVTFSDTCKILNRTKNNRPYKAIKFKGGSGELFFSLPTTITKTTLLGDEKNLTFNTFSVFRAKTFKISVE